MNESLQPNLYLASRSPRRRELLDQIGIRYQCVSVNVPELQENNESPLDYVQRLARAKALAGQQVTSCEQAPCLGSDTIVVCDGEVLEKPDSESSAVRMLLALSERTHLVMTAVAIAHVGGVNGCVNTTSVRFRRIDEAEARRYWASGEPCDKAGGYGIQGLGAVFIEAIEGSYSGVMGLPLFETAELLKSLNIPFWQERD